MSQKLAYVQRVGENGLLWNSSLFSFTASAGEATWSAVRHYAKRCLQHARTMLTVRCVNIVAVRIDKPENAGRARQATRCGTFGIALSMEKSPSSFRRTCST